MTEAPSPRQHLYTGPAVPQLPEPGYAERARTLISIVSIATLSTWSRKNAGYPFGSLMPFALDPEGRPILLISDMAMHTQNLKADPRASLFVGQSVDGDPLGAARATLLGPVEPIPAKEVDSARELYLSSHSNSQSWVDFPDFHFYRLEPIDLYYVGGFGVMGWVSADDYKQAKPDPLVESASRILSHMNEDHVSAMILLARVHSGLQATEAVMTSVDRMGFFVRLRTGEGMKGTRINFPREVTTAHEARKVLVEMVKEAEAQS